MIRYGVMCTPDGMAFDDGTVFRLAPEHYLVTTTTGNAAKVLDWMEEWLQTEWPHLTVWCASVTEQWATMAIVGPRSRALLSALAPELQAANEDFPFMAWRDTTVAGLTARVARISFSGELAYEVNVAWHDAAALWDQVWKVGEAIGLTPYGTEAMHVLRAEKGYPIIGQDTDGTITPQDLGMSWVVSKKKADFIGKRSYARADNARPDRKHLVSLLPVDEELLLPEGAQIVETADLPEPPVPMLGHVTSSYRSARAAPNVRARPAQGRPGPNRRHGARRRRRRAASGHRGRAGSRRSGGPASRRRSERRRWCHSRAHQHGRSAGVAAGELLRPIRRPLPARERRGAHRGIAADQPGAAAS